MIYYHFDRKHNYIQFINDISNRETNYKLYKVTIFFRNYIHK